MNLSEHFTLEEATHSATAERYKIDNTPDAFVLENMKNTAHQMEFIRAKLGTYILVSSWFRSIPLNRKLHSKDTSGHVTGHAVDFIAPKFGTAKEVAIAVRDMGIKFDQLIYEGTWVHISFAPKMRGQVLTIQFKPRKRTLVGIV